MAQILGSSTQVNTTEALGTSGPELNHDAATMTATGSASSGTVWIYVAGWTTNTALKVLLYNSSGGLIATLATFTSGQGTGWISQPFTATIASGTAYALAYFPSTVTANIGVADTATWMGMQNTSGTYASPPASGLSFPGFDNGDEARGRLSIWLDGAAAGGSILLPWQQRGAMGAIVAS